jgi:2-polyprenyl-3-methyl-5-hydroxy-6-metoxy-1,4-benzoquinol methylase
LETLLTACRADLLAHLPGEPAPVDESILELFCSLAQQCFVNDYVFACSDDELVLVRRLQAALLSSLEQGAPVAAPGLVALAAYVPLHSVTGAQKLLERPWPEPVRALLVQQIAEPLEERRARAEIPGLTIIEEGVSSVVRQQYEEHPYPRWVKAGPIAAELSIDHYIGRLFPGAPYRPLRKPDPDILVAGCGTGLHPIKTAGAFPKARVLAIDLSLTSLAYAWRKTRELGLDNVTYAQADLLKLGELGRRYDIIESVGVLSHLGDPFAGMKVLTSLLRPDGVFKVGLYSERARQDVVAVRAYIAERGYRPVPEDIRRCRQDLLALDARDRRRQVVARSSFASTSECRDLLFHAQETLFTLPEIGRWLERLGLTFIGFDTELEVKRLFRAHFPDPAAATDLGLWDLFEKERPDTFRGMYQFWVQK